MGSEQSPTAVGGERLRGVRDGTAAACGSVARRPDHCDPAGFDDSPGAGRCPHTRPIWCQRRHGATAGPTTLCSVPKGSPPGTRFE